MQECRMGRGRGPGDIVVTEHTEARSKKNGDGGEQNARFNRGIIIELLKRKLKAKDIEARELTKKINRLERMLEQALIRRKER